MSLIQEKFQTTAPEPPKGSNEWVPDKSVFHGNAAPRNLNALPPGTNIDDQALADIRRPMRTLGGETDVHDFETAEGMRDGYTRLNVLPTDDAYTAEHTDTFYGEAVSDGEVGFAERGNLLDRI